MAVHLTGAVMLCALVVSPVAAQDQLVSISGSVENGTEGAGVPDGLQVVLLTVDAAGTRITGSRSAPVDFDGRFSFEVPEPAPGETYRLVTEHRDVTIVTHMEQQDDWGNVRLVIHETTNSVDRLRFTAYNLLIPAIDDATRTIGALALVSVFNVSDRVIVVDMESTNLTGFDLLRFGLPAGYTNLTVESDLPSGNVMQIDTGFALTNPVPPGEHQVLFTYQVQYEGDSLTFPLSLPYGADRIRILMPQDLGSVSAAGLTAGDPAVIGQTTYGVMEGAGHESGSALTILFNGLPEPPLLQRLSAFFSAPPYVAVIVWLAGITLLGLLGYALVSTRRRTDQAPASSGRSALILEIAALDERHEMGHIDEAEYRRERDRLKELLVRQPAEANRSG